MRKSVEKMNAVIIEARWASIFRARMKVKSISRAAALKHVEQGIERGQKGEPCAGSVCGRMHINQPKEKQRGRRADGENDGDGWARAG